MAVNLKAVLEYSKQVARGIVDELFLYANLSGDAKHPRVLLFPSNREWDAASNLRAWLVAPALRKLGWRVTVIPPSLRLSQRRRIIRLEKPDVILMQQTRHPLNRPQLYSSIPAVLDADDADYLDNNHQEMIAGAASNARAVVGGSRFVMECLGKHNADANFIWTCTPRPASRPAVRPINRRPIVAWAHAGPLGYKEEAELMQEALCKAAASISFEFWLFGTTEKAATTWLAPLRKAGATCLAIPPLNYDDYLAKVAECAIGLQPVCVEKNEFSRGKSFGKILAYLSGEVAVVASDAVDHPLFFRSGENGILVPNDAEAWSESIASLVRNPDFRVQLATRGYDDFLGRLTTDSFAKLIEPILYRACGRSQN
jgi:hypothetical protein